MSTTTTTNYAFVKPDPGTEVDTWGSDINDNLDSIDSLLGGDTQIAPALASNAPGAAASAGTTGDITWDSNYIYICVATNTWKRAAISTW